MKPLRLLLLGAAILPASHVSADPPVAASVPTPSLYATACAPYQTGGPAALYYPAAPGAFGVPMVVPVVVPTALANPTPPADVVPAEDPPTNRGGAALFAPGMFGGLFTQRSEPATLTTTTPGVLNKATSQVIFAPTTATGNPAATATVRGSATTNVSLGGVLGNLTLPLSSSLRTQVQTLSQSVTRFSAPPTSATQTLINGILQNNTSFAALARVTLPGSGTINAGQQITIARLIQNDILSIEQRANPAVVSVAGSVALSGAAGTFVTVGNQLSYPLTIASLVNIPHLLNAPTPTGGGVVGPTRVSDGNSPLPRDRIIFDYDYLNSAALTLGGIDVHRFSVGVEKTFFDRWTSIEVRIPFASSLTSDSAADGVGNSSRTEFGDVNVTFKGQLYRSDVLNVGGGMGVALPTGMDTHVTLAGAEVLRVNNDTVVLTPFVAYLLTPSENLFFQNWYSLSLNTLANRVSANNGPTGLQQVGRLYDQNQYQIDAQLGYWLIHPETSDGLLRGLAPFIELHYNGTMGTAGNVRTPILVIDDVANGNFNELDLSVGAVVQLGDRVNFSAGATLPLLGPSGRSFDYEIGVRCNILFGPTYRDRTGTVSSF